MLKNLAILAFFTLFVVIVFVAVDLFLKSSNPQIPDTLKENLVPIEGKFDTEVLNQLKGRTVIPVDLSTGSNAVTDAPNATSGAQVTPTITVTPSPRVNR